MIFLKTIAWCCVAQANLTYFTHIVSLIFNFVLCTFSTPLPFCHFHQFVFRLRGWYGVLAASNRSCWKTSLPVCIISIEEPCCQLLVMKRGYDLILRIAVLVQLSKNAMSDVDSYIHQIEKYSQVELDLRLSVDFVCNHLLIHEIDAAHKLVVGNYYFRTRNLDLFCPLFCLLDTVSDSVDFRKLDNFTTDLLSIHLTQVMPFADNIWLAPRFKSLSCLRFSGICFL